MGEKLAGLLVSQVLIQVLMVCGSKFDELLQACSSVVDSRANAV